jgi:hypothetical protein
LASEYLELTVFEALLGEVEEEVGSARGELVQIQEWEAAAGLVACWP